VHVVPMHRRCGSISHTQMPTLGSKRTSRGTRDRGHVRGSGILEGSLLSLVARSRDPPCDERTGYSLHPQFVGDVPRQRAEFWPRPSTRTHGAILSHLMLPPSPHWEPYYQSLSTRTAASWPCFLSAAPHLKLCRLFISNNFRHSRLLVQNEIEEICPTCNEHLSVQHWLRCPLRTSDRALLASETGFAIDSVESMRNVLLNPRHSVALEFVLHRFFCPKAWFPFCARVDLQRLFVPWWEM
jgi:hypothetical protein